MSLLKKNKLLIGIAIITLGVLAVYKYTYKAHTTVAEEKVAFTGQTADFLTIIKEQPAAWTSKVILLEGVVTANDTQGFVLNEQVFCQFKKEELVTTTKESTVKVKGRVIGYDDLLDELKLEECIIK